MASREGGEVSMRQEGGSGCYWGYEGRSTALWLGASA